LRSKGIDFPVAEESKVNKMKQNWYLLKDYVIFKKKKKRVY
jgi:hypothetical protein